jgi:hypothetical protein
MWKWPTVRPSERLNKDTIVSILHNPTLMPDNGEIDVFSSNQNWISCTGFTPACIGTVDSSRLNWLGAHCNITKSNVDDLYNP